MPEPASKKLKQGQTILLGMGNPLLDISATCDAAFLAKYGLEADNAILAEEKHVPMYAEMVDTMKVDYIAGGATLNSIRVAQWIIGEEKASSYFGSIGDDKFGKTLQEKAGEAGINAKFQINGEHSTGTCGVLITGDNRSLVANLAAANHFTPTHFDTPGVWDVVDAAQFYYIAGFFLTVSPPAIMKVAQHATDNNKCFTMNLSAPFLCEFFKDPMMAALPFVDILFGNETEAVCFAKVQGFGTEDVAEIALKTAALEKSHGDRMVIFTQGADPTIVAYKGAITQFPIIPIAKEEIVDTNGAGDAFVGGFLSQHALGEPLEKSVNAGHWAANYIIQQSGCTLSEKPNMPNL